MERVGSSSPLPWGSLLVRVLSLGLLYTLLLTLPALIGHAQSESPAEPPSLSKTLPMLAGLSQELVTRLQVRQGELQALQDSLVQARQSATDFASSLADLDMQLTQAELTLESLRLDLQATSLSLSDSQTSVGALSKDFAAYRAEMQGQVVALGRERDIWRLGAAVVAAIAVVVVVYTVVK